ncbi:orotate phosphoribosyltransferase [Candidatus Poriferisodalis sp.]|uniref:orotate phosphoribosyltransferase n=1 Tax=Candidatus Poriferisodalis sp. TaxID=3101277 RepID=UPI003B0182C4
MSGPGSRVTVVDDADVDHSAELLRILRDTGLKKLDEAVQLASGEMSQYFIDGKESLSAGADLRTAAQAITERVEAAQIPFDAVGGLTLGADALAAAIAVVSGSQWFIVRKEPKNRGTNRLVEGKQIASGDRVLLIDDVVTTGGSILRAFEAVEDTGARVVAAATLVDRGDRARQVFGERSVPYFPMATYSELGIPPVGIAEGVAPHLAGG